MLERLVISSISGILRFGRYPAYHGIDLETCQSNPKFETVVLVAKELNISVDAAIFPEMVNQTVSKTVVDFFAGKSEAEIEKFIALCKQAETFQKDE